MSTNETRPATDSRAAEAASADLRTYREDFGAADIDSQWFATAYEYSPLDQHGISWELYWSEVQRLAADPPALHDYDTGERLRDATESEAARSRADRSEGVILVDGRRCYVVD